MKNLCIQCGKQTSRAIYQYCSNRCQREYQYKRYIENWKKGKVNGNRGIKTRNISGHLRRYLLEKYETRCSLCGWSRKHPVTGKAPLEIDHIDGDAENNNEENLRILCPNCHSLTPSYKSLNSGKGRVWRKLKYIKSKIDVADLAQR